MDNEDQIPATDMTPSESDGLIFACELDGTGGCRNVGWQELEEWQPGGPIVWMHLNYQADRARQYILSNSGLPAVIASALVAEEGRPRYIREGKGLHLRVRCANLNLGATPDDMVAVRMWIEPGRIITVRYRRMHAAREVYEDLLKGQGPQREGDLMTTLIGKLSHQINEVVDNIDDLVNELEGQILTCECHSIRPQISEIRRQIIRLRRYLAPQREVLSGVQLAKVPWIEDVDRDHLREWSDRNLRYIEDLDAARDQTIVASEELTSKLAEKMNRNTYLLAVVAGIFLPLGLITGLLGINVGGMPGVESSYAFWTVSALLVVLASVMVILFRKTKIM